MTKEPVPAEKSPETPTQIRRRIVFAWWAELTEQPTEAGALRGPNRRGEHAALRRCSSVAEVAFCSAYLRLRLALQQAGQKPSLDWLAVVAGVLAHASAHVPLPSYGNLGAQIGAPQGDKAALSGARFRRLLVAQDPDEVFQQMRRVLHILRGQVDVNALASDLLQLGSTRADDVRKAWAFAYYEASPEK